MEDLRTVVMVEVLALTPELLDLLQPDRTTTSDQKAVRDKQSADIFIFMRQN